MKSAKQTSPLFFDKNSIFAVNKNRFNFNAYINEKGFNSLNCMFSDT